MREFLQRRQRRELYDPASVSGVVGLRRAPAGEFPAIARAGALYGARSNRELLVVDGALEEPSGTFQSLSRRFGPRLLPSEFSS